MKTIKTALVLAVSVFAAFAQQDAPPPIQIGSITVSGSVRERVEFWDWFGGKGENSYAFNGLLAQVALSQNSTTFDWKLDFAAPILLGLPTGAVVAAPQGQLGLGANYFANNHSQRIAAMIFPKEAYLRFKTPNSRFQMGRFEFGDGTEGKPDDPTLVALKRDRISQRLIGTFGFTDVQRSFDGLNLAYLNGPWTVTTMSAIPTRGVYQVDGWGWVTTPFAYASVNRELKYSSKSSAEFRLFGIYYDDPRSAVLRTDNRTTAARAADKSAIHIYTWGGHYIQEIQTSAGTLDLLGWGALQTGNWGAQTQKANAYAAEGGFQPKGLGLVRPWLRGGYFRSSGDRNAKDNVHGTFFAILPTPRSYARYPFFNEMNLKDGFGEMILRPSKKVSMRIDAHHLSLSSANDLWYAGGGAYQPWSFGYTGRPSNGHTDFANLYDASLDYSFYRATSVGFYYGYAQGGDVMRAIYKHADSPYGFIELNYRF